MKTVHTVNIGKKNLRGINRNTSFGGHFVIVEQRTGQRKPFDSPLKAHWSERDRMSFVHTHMRSAFNVFRVHTL